MSSNQPDQFKSTNFVHINLHLCFEMLYNCAYCYYCTCKHVYRVRDKPLQYSKVRLRNPWLSPLHCDSNPMVETGFVINFNQNSRNPEAHWEHCRWELYVVLSGYCWVLCVSYPMRTAVFRQFALDMKMREFLKLCANSNNLNIRTKNVRNKKGICISFLLISLKHLTWSLAQDFRTYCIGLESLPAR